MKKTNLYKYSSELCFKKDNDVNNAVNWIKKHIGSVEGKTAKDIICFVDKMYEKGYSGRDMLSYIEKNETIPSDKKTLLLLFEILTAFPLPSSNCMFSN